MSTPGTFGVPIFESGDHIIAGMIKAELTRREIMTSVVNIRSLPHEKYDVYIGRGSPFGNPFRIQQGRTREQAIELYRQMMKKRMLSDDEFADEVCSLKGKRLGCFCKPLACHGDVIVEFLEGRKS